jgi:F-type H+-transporting ATPase subunit delta
MRDSVVARRYARAIYKVSHAQNKIAEVREDLGAFVKAYGDNADLRDFLAHPAVPQQSKGKLIEDIVGGKITADFIKFLIERGRLPLLPAIYEGFLRVYRREAGIMTVEVTSALPLSEKLRERLKKVLARSTGNKVEVTAVVDKATVGGLKLRVGDRVVDGTIAFRLEEIRKTMAGAAAGLEETPDED